MTVVTRGRAAQARPIARETPLRGVPRPAAWIAVLVVGACLVAAYFAVPTAAGKDLAYSGIGFASTLVILAAIRLRRPAERAGWYLFAAANLCFVLGDGVYDIYDLVLHKEHPVPVDRRRALPRRLPVACSQASCG